jgi:hypothetical protein
VWADGAQLSLDPSPAGFLSYHSVNEISAMIYGKSTIKSSLDANVSHFLRSCPITRVRRFLADLNGIRAWNIGYPVRNETGHQGIDLK